jgi:hypothetical protein
MAQWKILGHSELLKPPGPNRADRVKIFLEKIKSGSPFETTMGNVVIDKVQLPAIQKDIRKSGFSMLMGGKVGNKKVIVQYPKQFYKSLEFGGKGVGSGTSAEDDALLKFRKNLHEALAKSKTKTIKIKVGKRTVSAADIVSTPGTPKSDFHLIDDKGKAVAWISHKAAKKAKDFQQYGGLTKEYDTHYRHLKDVTSFLDKVRRMRPKGLERGDSLWRYVKDKKVVLYTVWGPDYGKARGINNVDEFHQDEMKLVKSGSSYEIKSLHKMVNGELPKNSSLGDYTGIYVARFTSDRPGLGIPFARIGVFARAYVSGQATEI